MPRRQTERRLTAILAADAVGYARLVARDEAGALAAVDSAIREALTPCVAAHAGRIVKTMGDGVLATFPSAIEALNAALEFQAAMGARKDAKLRFRVGVHCGDALLQNGDVFGDVVNLAARLERLASAGGVCVSERVREDAAGHAGFTFEDIGEQRLKNIDRPVRVYRVRADTAEAPPAFTLPDRPSIAVLPFENIGEPDQEYFADGVCEDIIGALSRWRWFFVIARNTSFTYKGRAVDVTRVGRELGVRYVLEGSVRRQDGRVRVVAQLIDATEGVHVWSDTFNCAMADLFAMQDDITEHVVNAIEPAMLHSEGARVAKRNVKDLSAFDCYQRGMWRLNQVSAEASEEAQALFEDAAQRDPSLALAHVGLARIRYGKVIYGWTQDAERDIAGAYAAGRTAVALDPRDSWAHFALAGPLLFMGRHDEALQEAHATITLNPNCALGQSRLAQVLIHAGRADEAIAPLQRCLRHNPFDPQIGAYYTLLALANYHAGQYEEAARHARAALRHDDVRAAGLLGASLARLGRLAEARAAFSAEMQARSAQAVRRMIPYARPEDFLDLLEGLRLAGLGAPLLDNLDAAPMGET